MRCKSPIVSVRAIERRDWVQMGITTILRMLVVFAVLTVLATVHASISVQALVLALIAELYMAYSVYASHN